MAESNQSNNPDDQPKPQGNSGHFSQQLQHNHVSARVPEKVARGVFSTGVIVIEGPYEFVLDFVMGLVNPRQVVSRVVMSPIVAEQFIHAMRDNMSKFESRFGPIQQLPKPPQPIKPPTIQEIYDDLKIQDEVHAGNYCNAVMIGHGPSEFTFDFITRFFPNAAVASRVFLAAPQVPRMCESLQISLNRFKARQNPGLPGGGPSGGSGSPGNGGNPGGLGGSGMGPINSPPSIDPLSGPGNGQGNGLGSEPDSGPGEPPSDFGNEKFGGGGAGNN